MLGRSAVVSRHLASESESEDRDLGSLKRERKREIENGEWRGTVLHRKSRRPSAQPKQRNLRTGPRRWGREGGGLNVIQDQNDRAWPGWLRCPSTYHMIARELTLLEAPSNDTQ